MIFLDFPFRKTKMSGLLLYAVITTFVSCSTTTIGALQTAIIIEDRSIGTSSPELPWAEALAALLKEQ